VCKVPHKPTDISPFAEATLSALAREGYGEKLSLGGAFGLAYYFEYRSTHDVDAWWSETATPSDRQDVIRCLEIALGSLGSTRTRSWGGVVSIELVDSERTVFSFQIAQRSAQLEPLLPAPWPKPMFLDSFADLLAAKMVALIERGAPRDFRDIHALCTAGLTDPATCWNMWRRRQVLSHGDRSGSRAKTAILTHLARIEVYRPLTGIADPGQRAAVEQLRAWFKKDFLDALLD
jgi:hypothetical protein